MDPTKGYRLLLLSWSNRTVEVDLMRRSCCECFSLCTSCQRPSTPFKHCRISHSVHFSTKALHESSTPACTFTTFMLEIFTSGLASLLVNPNALHNLNSFVCKCEPSVLPIWTQWHKTCSVIESSVAYTAVTWITMQKSRFNYTGIMRPTVLRFYGLHRTKHLCCIHSIANMDDFMIILRV